MRPSQARAGASASGLRGLPGLLARRSDGAVYVEFLIVFVPFFVFLSCLLQVALLANATIVVDRAAFAAARAAAVVVAECPANVGDVDPATVNTLTPARKKYVNAAAYIAPTPLVLDGSIGVDDVMPLVEFPDAPGGTDLSAGGAIASFSPMQPTSVSDVRVRVNTMFICKIPLASALVCSGLLKSAGLTPSLAVSSEAVFPYQGATYTYMSTCQ
jgi:Flp pilus assembly protein TadG